MELSSRSKATGCYGLDMKPVEGCGTLRMGHRWKTWVTKGQGMEAVTDPCFQAPSLSASWFMESPVTIPSPVTACTLRFIVKLNPFSEGASFQIFHHTCGS